MMLIVRYACEVDASVELCGSATLKVAELLADPLDGADTPEDAA